MDELEKIKELEHDIMNYIPTSNISNKEIEMHEYNEIEGEEYNEEEEEDEYDEGGGEEGDNYSHKSTSSNNKYKPDLYAKEYELIKEFEKSQKNTNFDYTINDIIDCIHFNKMGWLEKEDIKKDNMENTNKLLKTNLLIEMMCQDKKSTKINHLIDQFQEIYLRPFDTELDCKCESKYEHLQHLNKLIEETYHISQDPLSDEFYINCSKPKKRGRTSDEDRLKIPNIIDILRREYITSRKPENESKKNEKDNEDFNFDELMKNMLNNSKKSNDSVAATTTTDEMKDKYRVFLSILKLTYENIPKEDNHGFYISIR